MSIDIYNPRLDDARHMNRQGVRARKDSARVSRPTSESLDARGLKLHRSALLFAVAKDVPRLGIKQYRDRQFKVDHQVVVIPPGELGGADTVMPGEFRWYKPHLGDDGGELTPGGFSIVTKADGNEYK